MGISRASDSYAARLQLGVPTAPCAVPQVYPSQDGEPGNKDALLSQDNKDLTANKEGVYAR